MDDIGAFLIHPVTFAQFEALHAAVRVACAHVSLPVDGIRVAYSAHAHAEPTFGSPFVVVHLHVGTEDDVYDPFQFTVETGGGPEDCSLAAYVCGAFDLAVNGPEEPFQLPSECRGWTVARDARTNFHSVVECGPDADEGRDEDESREPLERLASDLRLSLPALASLLQNRASPWMPLSADPDEQTLAALRPLLAATP